MTKINWMAIMSTAALLTTHDIAAEDRFQPLDPRNIKIAGEIGRRIDLTIAGNLLKLNPDDHLKPFVTKNNRGAEPFIGTGKTLDGMVRLAAYSGDPALIARKKSFVETLLQTQEADGYIGIMPPDIRTWRTYDLHDQAFILLALIADHQLFGEKASLAGAQKLADYIIGRWPGKPADWGQRIPGNENIALIGLDMAFLSLHEATGEKRYLDFLQALTINGRKLTEWHQPIALGRDGKVFNHIYAYFSHCLVQLRLHRLAPDSALLKPTQTALDFLTRQDGMVITGGAGHDECWSNDQRGTGHLGETCATAYQIFVYDDLLRMQGDARWGDLIERTLYNAAYAAQSPDGRRLRYYAPFEGKRAYWNLDTYCCPGNYRRLIAATPQLMYYRLGTQGVAINLYGPSQATVGDVTVEQQTDYPSSGKVSIRVTPAKPATFPVALRIPRWCRQPSVAVNGQSVKAASGEFVRIERRWQAGDRIELDLPMELRFVAGRKSQAGRAAVMRGPVVYTLDAPADPVLQPGTAQTVTNDAVRPGGTACQVQSDAGPVTLTEFPDPNGQRTYFRLANPKIAVPDELISGDGADGNAVNPNPITQEK